MNPALAQLVSELDAVRVIGSAVADGRGLLAAPGGVLLVRTAAGLTLAAAGSPEEIAQHPRARQSAILDQSGRLLTPAFVNAHTHLDLTGVGPRPFVREAGFTGWIDGVRTARAHDPEAIARWVTQGAYLSLRGGVVAVGDIAGEGHLAAVDALRESPLVGVSYLEVFGMGEREPRSIERVREAVGERPARAQGIRIGLQPHAPYSAGLALYEAASALSIEHGLPLSTHLAESLDERSLIGAAQGPLRDFLNGLGLWTPRVEEAFGKGDSPAQHLAAILPRVPWTLAHANDLTDADIDSLALTRCSVVYCPRAWRYFEHARSLAPHRWRALLERGVNVTLGTDSVIGLPDSDRLSTLDEARVLVREEGADSATALRMITSAAARAIGLERRAFDLSSGPLAGLVAIPFDGDPARALDLVMESDSPPDLLLSCADTGFEG